ncbi:MAG: DUF2095 family protein [Promethearchaeota archaeon]
MVDNKKEKRKEGIEPIIKKQDGLTINYDKNKLDKDFPHLLDEITRKKKIVKIESIQPAFKIDKSFNRTNIPRELINPGAIDFIRRCTTKEEALRILDFLVKRKELSIDEYNSYKNQILLKEGLKKFIEEHGGFKSPGYYEKKFRNTIEESSNQNNIED